MTLMNMASLLPAWLFVTLATTDTALVLVLVLPVHHVAVAHVDANFKPDPFHATWVD